MEATQTDIATAFGVAVRTVQEWVRAGMPAREDGTYHVASICAWRQSRVRATTGAMDEVRLDKLKSEARIKAREADWIEANLFEKEDVERLFLERADYLRRGLLAMPEPASVELAGVTNRADIKAILTRYASTLLAAYSRADVVELLMEWRRQKQAGAKIGRGRGRPKGT